jgi:hypothetical protein
MGKRKAGIPRRVVIIATVIVVILFFVYLNYFIRIKRNTPPFPNGSVATALAVDHSGNVLVTGNIWRSSKVSLIGRLLMAMPRLYSYYYQTRFNERGELIEEGTLYACDMARMFEPTSIAETRDGYIYISGEYNDIYTHYSNVRNLNTGPGAFLIGLHRGNNEYVWGGPGNDLCLGLSITTDDTIYTVGTFEDTVDFNPSAGTDNRISNGEYDIFLSRFDSGGNYETACTWGGVGKDVGFDVCSDSRNNIYIFGYFSEVLHGDLLGDRQIVSSGDKDCLVMKMGRGGSLEWASTWGGYCMDECQAGVLSNSGTVVTAGQFTGTIRVDTINGNIELGTPDETDIFVAQLNENGGIASIFQLGSEGDNMVYGIASDSAGSVYITGYFKGTILSKDGGRIEPSGNADAFLVKYNPDGELLWIDTWGSPGYVGVGHSVVVDWQGNVYVAGTSEEHSFVRIYNSEGDILKDYSALEEDVDRILNPDGSGA